MARNVKVRLTDAMYNAARERAMHEGRDAGNDPGIASLLRAALRDRLSKAGYKVSELDRADDSGVSERSEG